MVVEKISEKEIERKLTQAVKNKGGLALKLTSPTMAGLPDRLVLLPKGRKDGKMNGPYTIRI